MPTNIGPASSCGGSSELCETTKLLDPDRAYAASPSPARCRATRRQNQSADVTDPSGRAPKRLRKSFQPSSSSFAGATTSAWARNSSKETPSTSVWWRATKAASGDASDPVAALPARAASIRTVPDPQKGSRMEDAEGFSLNNCRAVSAWMMGGSHQSEAQYVPTTNCTNNQIASSRLDYTIL